MELVLEKLICKFNVLILIGDIPCKQLPLYNLCGGGDIPIWFSKQPGDVPGRNQIQGTLVLKCKLDLFKHNDVLELMSLEFASCKNCEKYENLVPLTCLKCIFSPFNEINPRSLYLNEEHYILMNEHVASKQSPRHLSMLCIESRQRIIITLVILKNMVSYFRFNIILHNYNLTFARNYTF